MLRLLILYQMIYCKKINLVHENYIIKSILRQSVTNYGLIVPGVENFCSSLVMQ